MTQIKEIYKMIETVCKDDTTALDEIDAKVWFWIDGDFQDSLIRTYGGDFDKAFSHAISFAHAPQFTRSIDAQEQIATEGWNIQISVGKNRLMKDEISAFITMRRHANGHMINSPNKTDTVLQTEALARLHISLQVIEYERGRIVNNNV